jgi:hypothetical protein
VPWGVCKRRDKIARYVIANDRDAAMSGRWGGPELTSQIDPELTFLTGLAGGPRRRKADDEVPCDRAVTMRA